MWNRIFIFIGIVIFSRDVYILHSGTGSEVLQRAGKTGWDEMEYDRGMAM